MNALAPAFVVPSTRAGLLAHYAGVRARIEQPRPPRVAVATLPLVPVVDLRFRIDRIQEDAHVSTWRQYRRTLRTGRLSDRILFATAVRFGLDVEQIKSADRHREIARPRQIAMFLCKELTPLGLPEIGRRFGGRDHTTVLHAVRKIGALVARDAELSGQVASLRAQLEAR